MNVPSCRGRRDKEHMRLEGLTFQVGSSTGNRTVREPLACFPPREPRSPSEKLPEQAAYPLIAASGSLRRKKGNPSW